MSGFVDTQFFSYRRLNGLGLMVCIGAIAFTTTYLQEQLALEPCLLCSLTRLITLVIALIFFLAFFHNPGSIGQRFYSLLSFSLALTGTAVTIKHIWLNAQAVVQPEQCTANYDQLFATMPSFQTVVEMMQGASECATTQWTMIGMTIPEQALLLFAVLLVITLKLMKKRRLSRNLFR